MIRWYSILDDALRNDKILYHKKCNILKKSILPKAMSAEHKSFLSILVVDSNWKIIGQDKEQCCHNQSIYTIIIVVTYIKWTWYKFCLDVEYELIKIFIFTPSNNSFSMQDTCNKAKYSFSREIQLR